MKQTLLIITLLFFSVVSLAQHRGLGDTTDRNRPQSPGVYDFIGFPNGRVVIARKTGPLIPLTVDAAPSSLVSYVSVSTVRSWSTLRSKTPLIIEITDAYIGGRFIRDDSDNASLDNTGITVVTANGIRYKRLLYEGLVKPIYFGAIPDDNLDDSGAIQSAINAVFSTVGGTVRPSLTVAVTEGRFIVTTPINLTNTRTTGTIQRDAGRITGQGLLRTIIQGKTGAGNPIMEVTGHQWLTLENITLTTDGSTGSSTIGIYSGLFSALQQTQNQKFINVGVFMHSDTSANAHNGTVAYFNFGGEENTHFGCYYTANKPVVLTAYRDNPYTYNSAFGEQASAHSLGVTTFSGENFLNALSQTKPALHLIDVNSPVFENLYIFGIPISGITPTQFQAIQVQGGANNMRAHGTIEGFSGIVQVYGRLINNTLEFQLGGTNVSGKAVVQLEQAQSEGTISGSTIKAALSQETSRPYWKQTTTSANQVASSWIKDTEVFSDRNLSDMMLPEKWAFNERNSNVTLHSADSQPYHYESGQQYTTIPKTQIRGFADADTVTTIATITLPTAISATSALSLMVRLELSAGHSVYTSGSSTALFWTGVLPIVCDENGNITVGTPVGTNLASVAANPSGNNLLGIDLTATQSGNTILLKLHPQVSGSNREAVYATGKLTVYSTGHSCSAPSFRLN